ncbi:inosine triphosphate pyrophosphatase [Metschnikowia aff. pulcherrima]|uniref:Inosine triphosphate pyrophosphatase n=1 Tax=Metschnikowia aff. pulcherrima TaxID=2163413 RepID=A0A4P6XPC0_9ASCO|nr:inosine triphosphate pyrophosphatase [Metschnikowia aff. pulcherrima]
MSTLTFVTGNENKKKEVVAILGGVESEQGLKVGNHFIVNKSLDIEEVQGTIDEVTIHKARSAAKLVGGPVLVEDTCLAFTAFNDLPGPYIKWFVQSVGLQGLVNMLYKFEDKSAKAICTFGYCEGPEQEVKLFQGITHGKIVDSRGHKNFGWDSIFQPDGFDETYAEMDKIVKNGISHRYKALKQFQDFLIGSSEK